MKPWRRNFRAVWPSLFATSMGLNAFLPVLALYTQERFGIDDPQQLALWAGLIYGAAPFTAAVVGPLWGALGDQVGKRPMAIRANLAIAVSTALMPLAPSPLWLLVMRAVQGALSGYVAPAMALVSQGVHRRLHGLVIARLQVAMAVGAFLGPLLAAELTAWFGRAALFWATSVLSALGALQLHWFAREAAPPPRAARGSFVRALWQGSLATIRQRVFAALLLLILLLRLGQNMLEPFVALFVRELGPQRWVAAASSSASLALDRTIGIAFAVLAVAQWVFTPWWGRLADRFGPLRCLAALALVLAALQLAMAFAGGIDGFLLLRSAAACAMAGSMTLAYAAASKRVDDAHRTLAFSLVQSCMQFGFALGPLLGAAVATWGHPERTDFRQPFLAAAGLCAAAALGMLWLRRWPAGRDELRRPPLSGGSA